MHSVKSAMPKEPSRSGSLAPKGYKKVTQNRKVLPPLRQGTAVGAAESSLGRFKFTQM